MAEIETVASVGEDALIEAIARQLASTPLPAGWLGIGDDAAVTRITEGMAALTTTDLLVEDVHFRASTASAEDLGWKAIAVNASDIAAMGGVPRWATFSLALPGRVPVEWVLELYRGAAACARACELHLVGGDTVGSPGPIMLAVTVVGEVARPALRSGARPADRVLVTGTLGASAAGLWALEHPQLAAGLPEAVRRAVVQAHRRPVAQLEAGQAIGRILARPVMMDCSDGLVRSALVLAELGGLELVLEAAKLPIAPETRRTAELAGTSALSWALYGGEEYGLVVVCAPDELDALRSGLAAIGVTATEVGECRPGKPQAVLRDGTREVPLSREAIFHHF